MTKGRKRMTATKKMKKMMSKEMKKFFGTIGVEEYQRELP